MAGQKAARRFPEDRSGELVGTRVSIVRHGDRQGGTIMPYQHYLAACTVPVRLDDGRWTAATLQEVRPDVQAS